MDIGRTQLLADLVALQYRYVLLRGDFRPWRYRRVSAHYEDRAWRIELFGNEMTADRFDPLPDKIGRFGKSPLYANSHYVTPGPTLKQAMVEFR